MENLDSDDKDPVQSGWGGSFTARGNVSWLSFSASPSSDTRAAAIGKASTSFSSLDTSSSFCLKTAYTCFRGERPLDCADKQRSQNKIIGPMMALQPSHQVYEATA